MIDTLKGCFFFIEDGDLLQKYSSIWDSQGWYQKRIWLKTCLKQNLFKNQNKIS